MHIARANFPSPHTRVPQRQSKVDPHPLLNGIADGAEVSTCLTGTTIGAVFGLAASSVAVTMLAGGAALGGFPAVLATSAMAGCSVAGGWGGFQLAGRGSQAFG